MLDSHVPPGYRPVDRSLDATRVDPGEFVVIVDNRRWRFEALTRETPDSTTTLFDGVRCLDAPESGDVKPPEAGVPPALVRTVIGATYQYQPAHREPGTGEARVIHAVSQPSRRWLAEVRPGDGVVAPVCALLRDAACNRLQFVTLREPDDRVPPAGTAARRLYPNE